MHRSRRSAVHVFSANAVRRPGDVERWASTRSYGLRKKSMRMSIHQRKTRLLISLIVLLVVLALVIPHLMDVKPPLMVKILLKPIRPLGKLIGSVLPHPNIGTSKNPIYEGTPLDLIAGFALVIFDILLYPVGTYFLLGLLSRGLKRVQKTQGI
jgi:hypothetical protein